MGQNAGYFFFYLFSFKKNCLKNIDKHALLSYLLLFNKRLEFVYSIQNSHVHEPSKLVENLQHLHITTEKNLTSNHCLKLKSLGFSVSKYIVLTGGGGGVVSYFPYILLNEIQTMFSQIAKQSARVLPADLCTDHARYVKIHR